MAQPNGQIDLMAWAEQAEVRRCVQELEKIEEKTGQPHCSQRISSGYHVLRGVTGCWI